MSRESDKNTLVPLTKGKGLKNIGHSMSIGNLILVVSSATVSYLIRSLLENATAIITNAVLIILLQNASGFLLQNATVITKCDAFITNCDSATSKGNAENIEELVLKYPDKIHQ